MKSSVFYSRVKGELEAAILQLAAEATVIVRPALLLGGREQLGQPVRSGETLAKMIMVPLRALLPRNYRPIGAEKVARALLARVPVAQGVVVMPSGELNAY